MSVKRLRLPGDLPNKPTGPYQARYRDASGKEHAQNFPVGRKKQADDWERAQREAVRRGDWVDPAAGRLTVREYAETWRLIQNHEPSTRSIVERNLRLHIYPTFGDRRIGSIRPTEVQGWYANLTGAPATRRLAYTWLAAIFKAAVVDGLLAKSPCQVKVGAVAKMVAPRQALSVEQVAGLVEAAWDLDATRRYAGMYAFTAHSGLRTSEGRGLTTDRVDWLRRTVRVDRQMDTPPGGYAQLPVGELATKRPKSAAGHRTIPLAKATVDQLSAHVALYPAPSGLIFTSPTGAPLTRGLVSTAWGKAVAHLTRTEAGRDLWPSDWTPTFRDLRHHYASLLIHYGCSVKQVQRAMGHESASVTLDTYAHFWPDSDDEIRGAIERASGQGADGASEASAADPHPRALATGQPPASLVASVPGS